MTNDSKEVLTTFATDEEGEFFCFVHYIWRLLAFALPGLFVGPVVFPWHKATSLVVIWLPLIFVRGFPFHALHSFDNWGVTGTLLFSIPAYSLFIAGHSVSLLWYDSSWLACPKRARASHPLLTSCGICNDWGDFVLARSRSRIYMMAAAPAFIILCTWDTLRSAVCWNLDRFHQTSVLHFGTTRLGQLSGFMYVLIFRVTTSLLRFVKNLSDTFPASLAWIGGPVSSGVEKGSSNSSNMSTSPLASPDCD